MTQPEGTGELGAGYKIVYGCFGFTVTAIILSLLLVVLVNRLSPQIIAIGYIAIIVGVPIVALSRGQRALAGGWAIGIGIAAVAFGLCTRALSH